MPLIRYAIIPNVSNSIYRRGKEKGIIESVATVTRQILSHSLSIPPRCTSIGRSIQFLRLIRPGKRGIVVRPELRLRQSHAA